MRRNKQGAKQVLRHGVAMLLFATCGGFGAATGTVQAQAAGQSVRIYDIHAGDLATALNQFSDQSGLQVLFDAALVKGRTTSAVQGNLGAHQALMQLLKGSALQPTYLNERTVILKKEPAAPVRQPASPATPSSASETPKASTQLATVVVTGSRLSQAQTQGPQQVQVYTREDIAQSGQKTVLGFLNTLAVVSTSVTEAGVDTFAGAGTVRLRGLPVGSTLVLLDGRSVEGAGSGQSIGNPFDLNTIPAVAVERIEIVPEAASAVYGSDAIGGVVNIILRKDLDGGEVNVSSGAPTEGGYRDTTVNLAWGKKFERGAVSLIGSYETRGRLLNSARGLTADRDYTRHGGQDQRSTNCNPGNISTLDGSNLPGLSSSFAGVPGNSGGMLAPADFLGTSGVLNKCDPDSSNLPSTRRGSVLANGHYDLGENTQAFFQAMFSQVSQGLYGPSGTAAVVVPADNPFNPFHVPVRANYRFTTGGLQGMALGHTNFSRALGGLKGRLGNSWNWEAAAWQSYDHANERYTNLVDMEALQNALANPAPAQSINLFTTGNPASPEVMSGILYTAPYKLSSKLQAANAFVRGSLFDLPAGPVDVVLGAEFSKVHQTYYAPGLGVVTERAYSRSTRSLFGELRIPLLASSDAAIGDMLTASFAGRYDNYSDFGGQFTPQSALEFRPTETLLFRASYSKAYKAPDLSSVYSPSLNYGSFDFPPDPLRGGEVYAATLMGGGNRDLKPQTGRSRSIGVVWSSRAIENLQVSLTNFSVTQNNRITGPDIVTMIANPDAFPGLVVRAAPTAADIAKGYPGPITLINAHYVNFGSLTVDGFDANVDYQFHTAIGTFSPSLSVTEIYKYAAAVSPGSPVQNRLGYASTDAFATRWKGSLGLGYAHGNWTGRVAGRFISSYEDYDRARRLGDFWLFDVSLRDNVGKHLAAQDSLLHNAYAELSVVNALNRTVQFSSSGAGYDARMSDIIGRFVSLTVGTTW